jgi:hypothetical protein
MPEAAAALLPEELLCVSMRLSFVAAFIGEGLRPSPGPAAPIGP